MRQALYIYLQGFGFRTETLNLLNDSNLSKLAVECHFKQ